MRDDGKGSSEHFFSPIDRIAAMRERKLPKGVNGIYRQLSSSITGGKIGMNPFPGEHKCTITLK